jgi:hypothetical protein
MKYHSEKYPMVKDGELVALCELVDDFATEMKKKLKKQYERGCRGWSNITIDTVNLWDALLNNDDPIDIANYAVFIWNRKDEV